MKLPKLYRVVNVRFNSTRLSCNENGASELDEVVTRKAMRVLDDDGWRWALSDADLFFDSTNINDQIALNDYGIISWSKKANDNEIVEIPDNLDTFDKFKEWLDKA